MNNRTYPRTLKGFNEQSSYGTAEKKFFFSASLNFFFTSWESKKQHHIRKYYILNLFFIKKKKHQHTILRVIIFKNDSLKLKKKRNLNCDTGEANKEEICSLNFSFFYYCLGEKKITQSPLAYFCLQCVKNNKTKKSFSASRRTRIDYQKTVFFIFN